MANVSDVIFCLRATNIEGQGACATTILTSLTPEYIPGLFTFSVIITLLDIDSSSEHQLIVDFVSPADENAVHVESPLPSINEEINLKVSGEYTIKITVDGNLLKEKSIYVKGKNE